MEEFIKDQLCPKDLIYLNLDESLFKLVKFNKPGALACFGMCYKNYAENAKKLREKFNNIKPGIPKVDDMNSQLGGSLLINMNGKIIFKHVMRYVGDHAKPEEVITAIKAYFGNRMKMRILGLQENKSNQAKYKLENKIESKNSNNESDNKNKNNDIINNNDNEINNNNGFIGLLKSKAIIADKDSNDFENDNNIKEVIVDKEEEILEENDLDQPKKSMITQKPILKIK